MSAHGAWVTKTHRRKDGLGGDPNWPSALNPCLLYGAQHSGLLEVEHLRAQGLEVLVAFLEPVELLEPGLVRD